MSDSLQVRLDELIAWATVPAHQGDLLEARAAWFQRSGEVYEDDRALERRMAAFLEHYVCDRGAPWAGGVSPARARYQEALTRESPERAEVFRALTETRHGLYEVRELAKGELVVRALFGQVEYRVAERRQLVGLTVGDVLELRLVPFRRVFQLTPGWIWHPHEAADLIRAEAKRRSALAPGNRPPEADLVFDCAQRALKVDRYRQIGVEKIYAFGHEARSA